jgi:hypothetical protein
VPRSGRVKTHNSNRKDGRERPDSDNETHSPHGSFAYDTDKTCADALYLVEHAAAAS